jgi:hypothetical protein
MLNITDNPTKKSKLLVCDKNQSSGHHLAQAENADQSEILEYWINGQFANWLYLFPTDICWLDLKSQITFLMLTIHHKQSALYLGKCCRHDNGNITFPVLCKQLGQPKR